VPLTSSDVDNESKLDSNRHYKSLVYKKAHYRAKGRRISIL